MLPFAPQANLALRATLPARIVIPELSRPTRAVPVVQNARLEAFKILPAPLCAPLVYKAPTSPPLGKHRASTALRGRTKASKGNQPVLLVGWINFERLLVEQPAAIAMAEPPLMALKALTFARSSELTLVRLENIKTTPPILTILQHA